MRRMILCCLLLFVLLFADGCLSIVNNQGTAPEETDTVLGSVRQKNSVANLPKAIVMLPNGHYAMVLDSPDPTPEPTATPMSVILNIEGNILQPSPTPDISDIARNLPNPAVNRELVLDCLPCEAPMSTPMPTPTPTPTPIPTEAPCTSLDMDALTTILNNAGYTSRFNFCESIGDNITADVSIDGKRLFLVDTSNKKAYTALSRGNLPVLRINNRMIQEEQKGNTDAIIAWIYCQDDKAALEP